MLVVCSQSRAYWFLVFQMLSPTDCPFGFQSQMLWEFVFTLWVLHPGVPDMGSAPFPSLHMGHPSLPWIVLQVCLSPDDISTLSTLFDVATSLHLSVEGLSYQSPDHFLVYLHWCGSYLVVFMGTRWAQDLPIPPSSLEVLLDWYSVNSLIFLNIFLHYYRFVCVKLTFYWFLFNFLCSLQNKGLRVDYWK